jgi:uncharacterized protein (TIGR02231 family)
MNRHFFYQSLLILFTTLIFYLNAWALPAEIEPSSKIRNIVVFTQSAMIKKEARFPVKKGENIVRITEITPYLVDASVQVSIGGKSAVKISEIKVAETYLRKAPQDKLQKLQARLDNLDDLMKATSNEISGISSSNEFLKKVIPFSQNQKVTQSEVEAHARFLEKSLAVNYARIAGIEAKLKKLQKEKIAIENEMKHLHSSDKSKSVEFYLISTEDNQEITLIFSYVVNNAGWLPLYEIRADSDAAKINMNYFATIKQATGEDWSGVNVEISTAKPYNSKAPEDLTAWIVDVYHLEIPSPEPYRYLREESAKSMMKSEQIPDSAMPFQETRVKSETTSFSFIIPQKVSIPSDNQPHRVLIASSEKEVVLSYYAIPKLSKFAYLKADFKNPFLFPLLAGKMNVFLDGRLVSAAASDKTISPDEEIKLSLGVDEGIMIERKLIKKFTEYPGLISKETKVNYEYSHKLANNKGKEITITINDNFPVSRNEKIKVELEAPKKNEAEISSDGIITWKVKLAPGEKKILFLKFRVEYPKDLTVTGLE